jgi:hypothetical protein
VKHKTSRRPDPTPASTRRVPALSNAMITKLAAMTRSTMMQTDVAVYQDDLTINITLPDEMDVNGFSSPPMDNSDLSQAIFDAMRWHEPIPDVPPKTTFEPPALAESLVSLLAPKRHRAAIVGDLEETFRSNLQRGFTKQRAARLYCVDVARSLLPQVWAKRLGIFGLIAILWRHVH